MCDEICFIYSINEWFLKDEVTTSDPLVKCYVYYYWIFIGEVLCILFIIGYSLMKFYVYYFVVRLVCVCFMNR